MEEGQGELVTCRGAKGGEGWGRNEGEISSACGETVRPLAICRMVQTLAGGQSGDQLGPPPAHPPAHPTGPNEPAKTSAPPQWAV